MNHKTLKVDDLMLVFGAGEDTPKSEKIKELIVKCANILNEESDDIWIIYSTLLSLFNTAALSILESHGHKCRETTELLTSIEMSYRVIAIRFIVLPEMGEESEETKH